MWRFAGCELDESRWTLTVQGELAELEIKPLEILLELLRRPGEVVTKDELLEAVWPETFVVEGSLTTAISKLRKALRDDEQTLLVTAPRIGYRLVADVEVSETPRRDLLTEALQPGGAVPGRPQWRLARPLGHSRANEVWLAEHVKTGELRVFKFANGAGFLRNLKREVAISRLLAASLGERPDFAPALEWNFEVPPFFVEIAYRGQELTTWAAEQGGLGHLDLELRLSLASQICETVAAAHGLGVLHQDLKPANVVVSPAPDGSWRVAVVDFGSADVLDPPRLRDLNITYEGFEAEEGSSGGRGGTALYVAPEVLAGSPPSVRSDVYALGVMLYQLIVGDLTRPLAAGWEREITDPLLREDIAEAAAGDSVQRLASAAQLGERLRTLRSRRAERAAAEAQNRRHLELEDQVRRARERRPWVVAAVAALAIGGLTSGLLYSQARRDRDVARQEGLVAQQIDRFLANDLLARSNPFKSGKADETLVAAVTQAAPQIDRRFPKEPEIAAQLHQTIARALDRRGDWDPARREYERSAMLWRAAEGPGSRRAHVVELQRVMMEARTYQAGALDRARALLARETSAISELKDPGPEIPVWLASARGMVALIGDDAPGAARQFGLAAREADAHPELFDLGSRLTFLQREAFAHIRLGDGATAEALFRRLAAGYATLEGADSADVLMVRLNLAQALMVQGKNAKAVAEADALYPKMVQVLGPEHELTLQLLSTRAQSEGSIGRWNDAIADTRTVHELAVKTVGPRSFFAIVSQADGATAECRGGRLASGLRDAAAAQATAQAAFPGSGLESGADFTLAECLIMARRFGDAERQLAGVKPDAVAQLTGDPDWGANLDIARAQISLSRGDRSKARADLAAAADAMRKPTAESYEVSLYHRLRADAGMSSGV